MNPYYQVIANLATCGKEESIAVLERIAQQPLFGGRADKRSDLMPFIEREFNNVSPNFLQWANANLIPKPNEQQANGLTFQLIYDIGFKEALRNMRITN